MNDKYVPESVRERLVVNQRVRYMGDPDCSNLPEPGSVGSQYGAVNHEVYFNAVGETGIIIELHNRTPGHPYEVRMDERYIFGNRSGSLIHAAAHELALVEDE